jgi:hypothetical protein
MKVYVVMVNVHWEYDYIESIHLDEKRALRAAKAAAIRYRETVGCLEENYDLIKQEDGYTFFNRSWCIQEHEIVP